MLIILPSKECNVCGKKFTRKEFIQLSIPAGGGFTTFADENGMPAFQFWRQCDGKDCNNKDCNNTLVVEVRCYCE